MLGAGQHLQIIIAIIHLVLILVMNVFVAIQEPTQSILHQHSMKRV